MAEGIPLVDVGPLLSGDPHGLAKVASEIGAACREVGFFAVAGHGIDAAMRERTFAAAKQLFGASDAAKDAVSIRRSPHNRGYVGLKVEALDPTGRPDLKEAYNVGLELAPDDPEIAAGLPFRGVNLWPELPGFRDAVLAYYGAAWSLGRALHRAIASDLGLDADWFEDKLDRPLATLRLLHYPPRPVRGDGAEDRDGAELGAGEHTDYGNLTLLLTDEVGGLEVRRRDGRWLPVPFTRGALICNIGDCLMRWTNDVYLSTPHRVVSPPGRERFSIAFFLDANPEALVACLPTCRGEGERYPPVSAADYLRSRLDATYRHRRDGDGG